MATIAPGSARDVAVSTSAFAAFAIASETFFCSSSRPSMEGSPGSNRLGRLGNAPRRVTAPPECKTTLATSVLGQRVAKTRAVVVFSADGATCFIIARARVSDGDDRSRLESSSPFASSSSSSSSSSHSSQTRSARSLLMASTACRTRARSPTRTGSNHPGRPPAADTAPAATASGGMRLGVAASEKCTPMDFLRHPTSRTGSSHAPRAAFTTRKAVGRGTPTAETIRSATRSTSPASAATSATVSHRSAFFMRSATPAPPHPRSFEHGVKRKSVGSEMNTEDPPGFVSIVSIVSIVSTPTPTPTPTPSRFLEEASVSCVSSSATTLTPSGLAAADANLARVLFLAAPTESTSPVFRLTTRRTACAHAAACAPSEHPEGNCTYASSMDAFSTTTPRRAFEGERSGDSAADASPERSLEKTSVPSARSPSVRTSAFRNPQTRSSVSFISLERSTRCIALDALSYGR